ncbi:hypothetical protein AB870_26390 [Pandoraea faecigallinarum]|nr:hypothetical protein AB870_26390 [Pandoraea faecigallinarum]
MCLSLPPVIKHDADASRQTLFQCFQVLLQDAMPSLSPWVATAQITGVSYCPAADLSGMPRASNVRNRINRP